MLTDTNNAQIAEFNMWHHEMTAEEINTQTCGMEGTVSNWNRLRVVGQYVETREQFPDCQGKSM